MSGTLVQAVGWALVHLVWQGALVAALLAVALRLVPQRAAQVRYALACGALLLLTLLPVLTAAKSWVALTEKAARDQAAAVAAVEVAPRLAGVHPNVGTGGSGPVATVAQVGVDEARERLLAVVGGLEAHAHWVVLAWALGVMLASARVLAGWRQVVRLTRSAREAAPEWQAAVERLSDALGIRVPVRLLASTHVDVPSTVGWLKPVVLVPVAALAGLSTRQLELILAHELAHIRRHDYLVNLAQTAAETLLFYHPAVWWIGEVIRAERENCCDDLAVASGGTPVSYARALTALEALRSMPSPALSALGGSLPERVRRLVAPGARCASRWSVGASVLTLLLGLALTVPLAAVALPRLQAPEAREAVKASEQAAVAAAAEAVDAPAARPAPAAKPAPEARPAPAARPAPLALPHLALAPAAPGARDEEEAERDAAREREKAKDKDERKEQQDDVDARTVVGRDALSVDQLVSLRNAGIDAKAVSAYRQLGFEPTVENLVDLGHAGVTAEYVKAMRERFGPQLGADDLAGLKHLGVTPEFVASLERLGFKPLDADDVMGAKAVGVCEDYLRDLKAAGLEPRDLDELTGLRAVGVDAAYLKELGQLGLGKLDADTVQGLRALGVNAGWVKGLRDAGLGTLSADELQSLRALGVDAAFVKQMKAAGFASLSAEELVELKASGVTPEYLQQLRGR